MYEWAGLRILRIVASIVHGRKVAKGRTRDGRAGLGFGAWPSRSRRHRETLQKAGSNGASRDVRCGLAMNDDFPPKPANADASPTNRTSKAGKDAAAGRI